MVLQKQVAIKKDFQKDFVRNFCCCCFPLIMSQSKFKATNRNVRINKYEKSNMLRLLLILNMQLKKLTQQLRVLDALSKELGLIASTTS